MKHGDLIRYKEIYSHFSTANKLYFVRRTEPGNNWILVYGYDMPIQMSLMEVISESR